MHFKFIRNKPVEAENTGIPSKLNKMSVTCEAKENWQKAKQDLEDLHSTFRNAKRLLMMLRSGHKCEPLEQNGTCADKQSFVSIKKRKHE